MGCGNISTLENEKQKNLLANNNNKKDNNENIEIKNDNIKQNNIKDDNKKNDIKKIKVLSEKEKIALEKKKQERNKKKEKMLKEMKEYQKLIKRKRRFLNKNGEYEESEDSDSRLQYAKGKNLGKKRKKLTPEEIEDGIMQDQKEEDKRKGRKAYFSPMKKELPFRHKQSEGPYDPNTSKPYSLGYEDEIYRDINYGKPIRFYNQTWLTYDAPIEADIYGPRVMIPPGWRIPTLKDYKNLFKFIDNNNEKLKIFLTHEKLLNMKTEYLYITSDKVFPDDNNGYNSKAWAYFCIGFNFYDEIEYPGNKPLIPPNMPKKIISINGNDKNNVIDNNIKQNINANNEEFEDAIVSDDDDDFIKKMKKQLKKNKEDYGPLVEDDIRKKKRLYTPNFKDNSIYNELNEIGKNKNYINKENIDDDEEIKNNNIDENDEINEDEKPKKFIFSVNTYKYAKKIRCKLIANEVLDITFKCPLVIEAGYRSFFEIPKLYNITTFQWNFNDEYSKEIFKTSDKFIASHVFIEPGEYKIDLEIELFSSRVFHLSKKVWVIEEILFADEIILDGINYGQPIKIGNQYWLDRDILSNKNYEGKEINLIRGKGPGIHGENCYLESIYACPNGWRLPLKEEVEQLLEYSGKNDEQKKFFFTSLEGGFVANLDEGGFYDMICLGFKDISKFEDYINDVKNGVYGKLISDTKFVQTKEEIDEIKNLFKDVENNNNNIDKCFFQKLKNFYNIILNNYNYSDIFNKELNSLHIQNNKVTMSFRTTQMNSPYSIFNTRCILDQHLDLDLGIKESNFRAKTQIEFSLNYPNITGAIWNFGDDSKVIKDKLKVSHLYKEPNVYEIKVEVILFGEFHYEIKRKINILPQKQETKLESENDIIIVGLGDYSQVKQTSDIHFSHSSAPISPFLKENGFYISYNEEKTNMLKLCQVYFNRRAEFIYGFFETPLYEEEGGFPLDIVCTDIGCCLLIKDSREENNLYIEMVSHEGELLWRNNIMQNGDNPIKAKINQLLFYNIYKEKLEYGIEAMFHPYSGRLAYGNGRIACIFSYKNNFFGKNREDRIDNSADIIITYSEDGTEVNLVCPWSTSHSLTQRALFDGKYFITASLGDSDPHNIKVVIFEPTLPIHLGNYNPPNRIGKNNLLNKELEKIEEEKEEEKDEEKKQEKMDDDTKEKEGKKGNEKEIEKKEENKENNNEIKKLLKEEEKKEESKNEEKEEKRNEENKKDEKKEESKNEGNMNLSELIDEKDKKENEEKKIQEEEQINSPIKNEDINLQFYFPLQNKFLNNSEMLNVKSDKSLQDSFHSKNFEYYRQIEHLKMSMRHKYISKNIVEGKIPGNYAGYSSGRLGGLHLLPNNKILMFYSRIECDNDCGDKNDKSELCFLSFNNQLKIEKNIPFRPGKNINCIKHARYGDNIFIMISETTKVTDDRKYIYDKYSFYSEEIEEDYLPCNCFLVNENGEIISNLFSFDFNFFSPNDDFETLKDGSVVWTFVDDDNNLYLCFLACSQTLSYLNKFPDEIILAGKYNEYLFKKREEEEEEKKRKEKEFLKSIGIDDDLIKKKLLESELMEKERIAKELEQKRLEDEMKAEEEEKKRLEEEEKNKMLKEIEEEARLREKMKKKEEEEERRKKEEEEKRKKKKKKRGKDWDFSESSEEEEEEEEEEEKKDENLSNYFM